MRTARLRRATHWLTSSQDWATGHPTGEGWADGAGLSLMASNWLFGTPPAAVPEPMTLSVIVPGGLAPLTRRSR